MRRNLLPAALVGAVSLLALALVVGHADVPATGGEQDEVHLVDGTVHRGSVRTLDGDRVEIQMGERRLRLRRQDVTVIAFARRPAGGEVLLRRPPRLHPQPAGAAQVEFTLPRGYLAADGTLHREGAMRPATAAEELVVRKDPRVQANPAYQVVILLSRVVVRLGTITTVTPGVIEGLFAGDFAYLQDLYNRVNASGTPAVKATCPRCGAAFQVEVESPGEP